jgi:hypothetical protein
MAKAETTAATTRAPRGAKPVAQAFFAALESVPEAARSAVAKAAQVMIRDEIKNRREKVKAAAAKEKARRPVAAKRTPKTPAPEVAEPVAATPAKPRSRKQAGAPVAA